MADISKNKRPGPRSGSHPLPEPYGISRDYHSAELQSGNASAVSDELPASDDTDPGSAAGGRSARGAVYTAAGADVSRMQAVGDPPGSGLYFGASPSRTAGPRGTGAPGMSATPRAGTPGSVGDAPGSPTYYGAPAPGGAPRTDGRPSAPARSTGSGPSPVGEPPGSPAYFGRPAQPHVSPGSRTIASQPARLTDGRLPHAVGEPPGSPAYFGGRDAGGRRAVPPSVPEAIGHAPGSAAYRGVAPSPQAGVRMSGSTTGATAAAVGSPPGTAAYFGSRRSS